MINNRFFYLIVFIFLSTNCIMAQSSKQKNLLYDFFNRSDVQSIIQEIGHPSPSHNGVSVTDISNNTITFRANYSSFWFGSYSCTYKLIINDSGKFLTQVAVYPSKNKKNRPFFNYF